MPKYKLHYFPLRGRAEIARLIFAYADAEYENVIIPFADWPVKRNEMPFKRMPVLEIDGVKYAESAAINRYLARQFGLVGKTSEENLKADELAEAFYDLISKLPFEEKDEEKKKELVEKCFTEVIPPALEMLEANMVGPYYAGSQMTYADIGFFVGSEYLLKHRPDVFDKTPKLMALYKLVKENPNIAKYLASRPDYPQ